MVLLEDHIGGLVVPVLESDAVDHRARWLQSAAVRALWRWGKSYTRRVALVAGLK